MNILKQFAECGKCHLYQNGICALTKEQTEPTDNCKNFRNHINGCDICGRGILRGDIISGNMILCQNCLSLLGTCAFCEKAKNCQFEEYTGPLPKIILAQKKQGNMVIQTQIRNPEICCNCVCFDNENCLRDTVKCCEKYVEIS